MSASTRVMSKAFDAAPSDVDGCLTSVIAQSLLFTVAIKLNLFSSVTIMSSSTTTATDPPYFSGAGALYAPPAVCRFALLQEMVHPSDIALERYQQWYNIHKANDDPPPHQVHSHFLTKSSNRHLATHEAIQDIHDTITGMDYLADVLFIGFVVQPEWDPFQPLDPASIKVEQTVLHHIKQHPIYQEVSDNLCKHIQTQVALPHIYTYYQRLRSVTPGCGYAVDRKTSRLCNNALSLASGISISTDVVDHSSGTISTKHTTLTAATLPGSSNELISGSTLVSSLNSSSGRSSSSTLISPTRQQPELTRRTQRDGYLSTTDRRNAGSIHDIGQNQSARLVPSIRYSTTSTITSSSTRATTASSEPMLQPSDPIMVFDSDPDESISPSESLASSSESQSSIILFANSDSGSSDAESWVAEFLESHNLSLSGLVRIDSILNFDLRDWITGFQERGLSEVDAQQLREVAIDSLSNSVREVLIMAWMMGDDSRALGYIGQKAKAATKELNILIDLRIRELWEDTDNHIAKIAEETGKSIVWLETQFYQGDKLSKHQYDVNDFNAVLSKAEKRARPAKLQKADHCYSFKRDAPEEEVDKRKQKLEEKRQAKLNLSKQAHTEYLVLTLHSHVTDTWTTHIFTSPRVKDVIFQLNKQTEDVFALGIQAYVTSGLTDDILTRERNIAVGNLPRMEWAHHEKLTVDYSVELIGEKEKAREDNAEDNTVVPHGIEIEEQEGLTHISPGYAPGNSLVMLPSITPMILMAPTVPMVPIMLMVPTPVVFVDPMFLYPVICYISDRYTKISD
ncbi:hypothetical protein BDY19DRAFT_907617 [Irpex rosettiformis]|uniref:Uncharacterized protein n=1 Tax=Irpex rosettiformis TaxID=378272 RepID=A0ACB8TZE1_9APHY|nr:hypothetical protein BDY19DRAFT_907617 [Irpex rosettiformis]